MLENSDGIHSVYRVLLSKCDPCPSPTIGESAAVPAVWEGLYKMEKEKNRSERTQRMDRRKNVRNSVCTAFGCCDVLKTQRYFVQLVDSLRVHKNYVMSVLMTK